MTDPTQISENHAEPSLVDSPPNSAWKVAYTPYPPEPVRLWRKWDWDDELSKLDDQYSLDNEHLSSETQPPTISMPCLGRLGLWGNGLLQYAFLKAFARKYGYRTEVPQWLGQFLLDNDDPPVVKRHEAVVLDGVSMLSDPMISAFWMSYDHLRSRAANLAHSTGQETLQMHEPQESHEPRTGRNGLPFRNAELEGFFLVHTRYLSPYKEYLRDLFKPAPAIGARLAPAVARLRSSGRTIVGIHIRRRPLGENNFMEYGWELTAPINRYLNWLEAIWPELDQPALFVCSDNLPKVLPHFAKYNPVTSASLDATMPAELNQLEAPLPHLSWDVSFFPDWYLLTQCDRLATSISTFSFSACMMNRTATSFFRPTFTDNELVSYDPWNSEPLLFLPPRRLIMSELSQRFWCQLRGLGPSFLPGSWRLLYYHLWIIRARAFICRRHRGWRGLLRAMVDPRFTFMSRRQYDS